MLMVGALGPLAPPPRGPAVDAFCLDGGRFRTSSTASQGPAVDILHLSGSRSQTSDDASQGALYEQDIFSVKSFWVLTLLRI
jgi:hypothetical protein